MDKAAILASAMQLEVFQTDAIPSMELASAGQDLAVDGAMNVKQISGAIRTWSVIRANAT